MVVCHCLAEKLDFSVSLVCRLPDILQDPFVFPVTLPAPGIWNNTIGAFFVASFHDRYIGPEKRIQSSSTVEKFEVTSVFGVVTKDGKRTLFPLKIPIVKVK